MPPLSKDLEDFAVSSPHPVSANLRKCQSHEVSSIRKMVKRRTQKVRFAHDSVMKTIKYVEDIPMDCRPCYWMSKREFEAIRKESAATAALAKEDQTVDYRGLESSVMTGETFLKWYLHRRGAWRAVLKEQSFQRETGYHDPYDIADAYVVYSEKSMKRARDLAQHDQQVVRCSN